MSSLFAFGLILLALFWPLLLLPNTNLKVATCILMFVVLLFAGHYNGSEMISFWSGLTTIVDLLRRRHPRGWSALALPVLALVLVAACIFTLVGFVRGRETTQLLWIALVGQFAHDRR